jgi:hypothetical protein
MLTLISLLLIAASVAYLAGRDLKINTYERRIERLVGEVRRLQGIHYRALIERKRIPAATFNRDYVWAQEDRDMDFFDKTTWIEE